MSEARRQRVQKLTQDVNSSTLRTEQQRIKAELEAQLANKLDASELPAKSASDASKVLGVASDGTYELVPVRPADQFLDLTGGSEAIYTVYGVANDWYATKATSSGMTTSAGQTTALPNLATLQGLTYS